MSLAGTLVPIPSIVITSGTLLVVLQATTGQVAPPSSGGGESWG